MYMGSILSVYIFYKLNTLSMIVPVMFALCRHVPVCVHWKLRGWMGSWIPSMQEKWVVKWGLSACAIVFVLLYMAIAYIILNFHINTGERV